MRILKDHMAIKSCLPLVYWISANLPLLFATPLPLSLPESVLPFEDTVFSTDANLELLSTFGPPRCYDPDPDTLHLPLSWSDCDVPFSLLRQDPDYISSKVAWQVPRVGDYRQWPPRGTRSKCVIVIGCDEASLLGRFTLLQVDQKLRDMKVHCPRKGGKQYVHTGTKSGWYMEIYRPTAREEEEAVGQGVVQSVGDGVIQPMGTEK